MDKKPTTKENEIKNLLKNLLVDDYGNKPEITYVAYANHPYYHYTTDVQVISVNELSRELEKYNILIDYISSNRFTERLDIQLICNTK
jgi:hypothetical protein